MPVAVIELDVTRRFETAPAEKSSSAGTSTPFTPLSPPSTPRSLPAALGPTPPPAARPAVAGLTAPTPLDAKWYPHLIDTIISYSSLATLRCFRATCRQYRDRVTPLLYSHCLLDSSAGGQVYATDALSSTSKDLLPLPITPASTPLLSHLRTLDIVGPSIPPALAAPLQACALRTIRLSPNAAGRVATTFPPAATLVLFGDVAFRARIKPKGLQKIVHHNPTLRDIEVLNSFHREYEGAVPHIVLIFTAWADKKRKRPDETKSKSRASTLAMAIVLLLAAGKASGIQRRITVVGLEGLKAQWLGLAAAASADVHSVDESFRQYIAGDDEDGISNVRDILLGTRAEQMLATVEYVSLAQYGTSMTPGELAVETCL